MILPTRDRAATLGRAIDSVLGQTHRRLELIVVDDGSRDATTEVLASYGERIVALVQPAAGPYVARNLGLDRAGGEFVAFMDSDDVWRPDRLAAQLRLMRRPQVGLVFGDAVHRRPGSPPSPTDPTCFAVTPPSRGHVADRFTWGNFVPTVTVLARRSCLAELGGFPTTHEVSADFVTWFRIALRHELDYVPGVLAEHTVGAGGISQDLGRALQARAELFDAELARTTDPDVRRIVGRIRVGLGLHLAAAIVRGRAGAAREPWLTVRSCFGSAPVLDAAVTCVRLVVRRCAARARLLRAASRTAAPLAAGRRNAAEDVRTIVS